MDLNIPSHLVLLLLKSHLKMLSILHSSPLKINSLSSPATLKDKKILDNIRYQPHVHLLVDHAILIILQCVSHAIPLLSTMHLIYWMEYVWVLVLLHITQINFLIVYPVPQVVVHVQQWLFVHLAWQIILSWIKPVFLHVQQATIQP